jgi:phage portal protein BeeE
MPTFQTIGSYFRNLAHAVVGRSIPSGIASGAVGYSAGGPIYLDAFHSKRPPSPQDLINSWKSIVFSCTRLNMSGVARTPLKLYARTSPQQRRPRRSYSRVASIQVQRHIRSQPFLARALAEDDAIDEIKEHPFLEALNKPNKYIDGTLLIHHIVASMDVVGTAYLYPERPWGPDGNPDVSQARAGMQIWPLQSQYVVPVKGYDQETLIREYDYFGETYAPDSLIRIRNISLRDPYLSGYSPLHACFEQQGLTDYYKAIVESILKTGARPALMVSPADAAVPFGEIERKRLEVDINNRFTGGRSGHVWVNNTALKVEPISYTPADLAGLTISKDMRLEIANCLDIPISMLQSEDSNRAVSQEGTHQHQYYAIQPRCVAIAEALTQQWAQLVDDRLFFCFDDPVARDDERDAKVIGLKVADGRMTINEAREEHGLPPVEWGDEPWFAGTLKQPSQIEAATAQNLQQQQANHAVGLEQKKQGLQHGAENHQLGKQAQEAALLEKKLASTKDAEDRAREAQDKQAAARSWNKVEHVLELIENEYKGNGDTHRNEHPRDDA